MNEADRDALGRLLKEALRPAGHIAPGCDLWPEMRRRLETPRLRVTGWDWILTALAALWLVAVPPSLSVLLYLL